MCHTAPLIRRLFSCPSLADDSSCLFLTTRFASACCFIHVAHSERAGILLCLGHLDLLLRDASDSSGRDVQSKSPKNASLSALGERRVAVSARTSLATSLACLLACETVRLRRDVFSAFDSLACNFGQLRGVFARRTD